MLTPGPAINNTKAAPGDKPLSIKAAAIGMLPVEHTYIGTAINKTINIVTMEGRLRFVKNESGTNIVINVPIINPITNHLPIFCTKSIKLYFKNSMNLLLTPPFFSQEQLCLTIISSFENQVVTAPPAIDVSNAANGRTIAKGRPIIEYVAIIESTPICGVDIMNETVAPREAPSFLNEMAVGMTPHEHNGSGTPISAANNTDLKFSLAKCFSKNADGTKT